MVQNHSANCHQNLKIQASPIHFPFTCLLFCTTIQTISIFIYTFINCVLFRQTSSFCMMFISIVNTIRSVVAHHSFYNKQNFPRCATHILVTVTLSVKHQ